MNININGKKVVVELQQPYVLGEGIFGELKGVSKWDYVNEI